MEQTNPLDTIKNLIEAINKRDVNSALSFYEPDAVLVGQTGDIAKGRDAIRVAIEGFISLKPVLKGETHKLFQVGEIALYVSKWSLVGTSPDNKRIEMNGISSDILRRQTDGQWLVVVDNPWGTSIIS